MKLRVLIVEDEDLPRQRVRELVQAHSTLELVGEASDGAQALDLIVELQPDLVFLDVQMPELDGFQVIHALEQDILPAVVFVTAYDAYAIRAFEVDAIDYLLKPLTEERFAAAVARALNRLQDRERAAQLHALADRVTSERGYTRRFVARRGGKHYLVPASEVEYLESEGNYVRLHAKDASHLIRATMKDLETRLDPAHFIRIHRGIVVAIDRITAIEPREHGEYAVTTTSGARLLSSRSYSERLRALVRPGAG